MNEYSLISPEKVQLNIELAGVGSRFVALFIDYVFKAILLALFIITGITFFGGVVDGFFNSEFWSETPYYVFAFGLLVIFVITYGYSIIFETIWNGQTPGKRFLKLRVVQKDGSPVTFSQVLVRNMLATVDYLPVFYGAGIICILITKKNQRLGDLAAGTIVSREKNDYAPLTLSYDFPEAAWASAAKLYLPEITEDEFGALKQYLLRKEKLKPEEALRLEQKLTAHFSQKLRVNREEIPNFDIFLKQVAQLYQTKQ